ncbi:hypothetical protein Ciccas_008789 [Cichlidogyrus casuarinus]|uniref:Uncharacterized protein n=1 Tax=Cichlidogyrus casuarinus TaxID=1844966 RepID=A0ABD2PYX0_9PLAT
MLCCRCQRPTDYALEHLVDDIASMMNPVTSEYGMDGFPVFSTQIKMIGEFLIRSDYGFGSRGAYREDNFMEAIQAFRLGLIQKGAYMGVNTSRIVEEFDKSLITINTCCFEYIYLKVVIGKFKAMVDSVLQPYYLLRTGIRGYFTQM